ncbi:MAG: aminoacetone oxidase family FAD-binding enzyme, partial [Verrucomicrobiaceae bacterium]
PSILIDFKPTYSVEQLVAKLATSNDPAIDACHTRWKLSDAAHVIICNGLSKATSAQELAIRAKACPVNFTAPRPIDEAISSAGGVCWDELDSSLMLKKFPGIFISGEMIDWEAPTGGYLMQGCFATATLAGIAATA